MIIKLLTLCAIFVFTSSAFAQYPPRIYGQKVQVTPVPMDLIRVEYSPAVHYHRYRYGLFGWRTGYTAHYGYVSRPVYARQVQPVNQIPLQHEAPNPNAR